ncbi:uncharacterized protein EURHEDRAFT_381781 [Aspergillus ruber CBS 135680]|uniref:Uncharacterized protein n=1 Tax=Aspergillus ruber (strain CBS 135680) TaxID=1388766 RepID=A0A017S3C8_ASPRC|nr:uncharacterized protein EURHEDRAFT_381781 [Aspergillus ruber CBS 135680]EYE90680.1 hypothetical protein EURHEDRAFT_381781 [Aspergillus ruber CBS 135680]
MRWTTENENILWRTIFHTQDLALELEKVSQAWLGNDKPTPKIIEERLNKCRQTGNNKAIFSMGPKNAIAPATTLVRATVTLTVAPRKLLTSKKAAAAAICGNFGTNGALAPASAPALTTMGMGTGQERTLDADVEGLGRQPHLHLSM